MARIESSFHVPKRVEVIYSFLDRRESHRRFIPRMTKLEQLTPGAFGQVGTRLSGMLNYFGVQIPVKYEIIEVETNRQLAMKGQMGPVFFKDGYVLEASGDGTQIKFWLDLLPTGWVKLFSPFLGLIGRIHAWETIRNLKRELSRDLFPN